MHSHFCDGSAVHDSCAIIAPLHDGEEEVGGEKQ